ncbi:MAG: hypothetical protein ACP5JL_03970, partial [bacterium]
MRKLLTFVGLTIVFLLVTQSVLFAITPKELLDKVTSKSKDIKDSVIELSVGMSLAGSETTQSTTKLSYRLKIESIVNPPVVRITYLDPEAFKGTIMVIDSDKKLLSMYSPLTNQVIQSKIENSQTGSNMDISNFSGIFQDLE